jgi:asparagine synthase (glutamine-hydrolysing)
MCGIAGAWSKHPIDVGEGHRLGQAMAHAMKHRGPDCQNVWVDAQNGIVLAHARLSVIDLSEAANQPFVSEDGRYVLIYNGEIYNFQELRATLVDKGYIFKTSSDTEVILHSCGYWGVTEAAKRFIGMFAFAVWDRHTKSLKLVRDPIGIKPLYYGEQGGVFLFSSTLAAITRHPAFTDTISPKALAAFFRYSYVPAPHSIYSGIGKLLPGHVLTINQRGEQSLECYWNSLQVAREGLANPFADPDTEIINAFERLARDSVRRTLVSDVPIGAFLSGGIDSSLVAALMQEESNGNAKTFTVGFTDADYDESNYARKVAQHLGCEHNEIICSTQEAKDLIHQLPNFYDEPFADSSQLPTLLLSKLTRQSVTVALSGDGGDELFAGYDRYYWMDQLQKFSRMQPALLQRALRNLSEVFPRHLIFPALQSLPGGTRLIPRLDGWYHLARMMGNTKDFKYLYHTTPMTVCAYRDVAILRDESEPESILDDVSIQSGLHDILRWMQFVDQQTYLPEDILQKVDRASMAFSLEARVPLLDHRLVEFAWRTPAHLKMQKGRGKVIMRQVLERFIPKELIERPKRGFSIPLSKWLKTDLRPWAESLINSSAARDETLLISDGVQTTWNNFLTGQAEHTLSTVWNLLMYLQWRMDTSASQITYKSLSDR